ncbi:MAG: ATPase, partial [Thermoguttaceae bacterium]|nr:ATPase [Thermoguttaceae bacterium]
TSNIYIDDSVRDYILNIVQATRSPEKFGLESIKSFIEFGASPRGSIWLGKGARAAAFLAGRGYVTPQDVQEIVHDVLRHRVILTYEAEAESITAEEIISRVINVVPVP